MESLQVVPPDQIDAPRHCGVNSLVYSKLFLEPIDVSP
jgi:hypothetical protein